MAPLQEAFNDLETLTLNTIIELQLDDCISLARSAKGKHREGTVNDAEVALRMYTDHLHEYRSILEDRKIAMSMALGVHRGLDSTYSAHQLHKQASQDLQHALELSHALGDEHDPNISPLSATNDNGQENGSQSSEQTLNKAAAHLRDTSPARQTSELGRAHPSSSGAHDISSVIRTESDAPTASLRGDGQQQTGYCIACGDTKGFYDVVRVPCGHEYCRECLARLFQAAMRDESLFPPRCDGQEMTLSRFGFFLPPSLVQEFRERSVEFGTKNRIYCHDPRCSTFLPMPAIEDIEGDSLTCPSCKKKTCTVCKAATHTGDCPDDTSLQQLLQTASNEQWQRCYRCYRLLEKEIGCNQMTCPCHAQFCYVCGLKWKTCKCPKEDQGSSNAQHRLLQPTYTTRHQSPARRLSAAPGPSTRLEGQGRFVDHTFNPVFKERLFDLMARQAREQDWYNEELERVEASSSRLHLASPEAASTGQAVTEAGPATAPSHGTGTFSAERLSAEQRVVLPILGDASSGYTSAIPRDARDDDNDSHHSDVSDGPSPDMVDAINHLRDNDECSHDEWRLIRGPYRCDECERVLTSYIFECRQCLLQACSGCRESMLDGV